MTSPPPSPQTTQPLRWTRLNHGAPPLAEYKQKHPRARALDVAVLCDREQVARVTGSADDLRVTVEENLETGGLTLLATEQPTPGASRFMRYISPLSADAVRALTRDIPRDWFLHPENRAAPARVSPRRAAPAETHADRQDTKK